MSEEVKKKRKKKVGSKKWMDEFGRNKVGRKTWQKSGNGSFRVERN